MEAPWVKGAMGQQQKVACMVLTVDYSGLALLEVWITTSWLSGYLRTCNVRACCKGWPTLSRAHQAGQGPRGPLASAGSSLPTAT